MSTFSAKTKEQKNRHREGWMLCMLLTVCVSQRRLPEELLELVLLAKNSMEFRGLTNKEFEEILQRAQEDLHHGPEKLLEDLQTLLDDEESRLRAIQFASHVASASGTIRRNELAFVFRLKALLKIKKDDWKNVLRVAVLRLSRYATMAIIAVVLNQESHWDIRLIERILNEWRKSLLLDEDSSFELQQYMLMISRQLDRIDNDDDLKKFCETIAFAKDFLKEPEIPKEAFRLIAQCLHLEFPPPANRLQLLRFIGDHADLGALEVEDIMAEVLEI